MKINCEYKIKDDIGFIIEAEKKTSWNCQKRPEFQGQPLMR